MGQIILNILGLIIIIFLLRFLFCTTITFTNDAMLEKQNEDLKKQNEDLKSEVAYWKGLFESMKNEKDALLQKTKLF